MSADIVKRLREVYSLRGNTFSSYEVVALMGQAADEIERLQELLREVGANRYWEGRWRDSETDNERLRAALEEIAWENPSRSPAECARRALERGQ